VAAMAAFMLDEPESGNKEEREEDDDTKSAARFSLGETKVQTFRDERFFYEPDTQKPLY